MALRGKSLIAAGFWGDIMITLARHAMATRFELVLHGDEEVPLRAAGDAALDEIERLDEQLSFFRPTSEVAAVNRWAAEQPIKLEPRLVGLLQRCQEIWTATGGAFDPTIGPITRLLRPPVGAWLSTPRDPAVVRGAVGFEGVVIDPDAGTVRFVKPGMALDLGAVGRGYAIDRGIEILGAHGVTSALLRGGTSSVHVIGTPPGEAAWSVGWDAPAGSHAGHRSCRWSIRRSRCRGSRRGRTGAPWCLRAMSATRGPATSWRTPWRPASSAQLADVRHALDGAARGRRVVAGDAVDAVSGVHGVGG